MSFETGTAAGIEDLLDKWFDFLLANGWTADVDYTSPGQSPDYGVIHRRRDDASPLGSDPQQEVNITCGFSVSQAVIQIGPSTDNIFLTPMRSYGGSGDPGLNAIFGSNSPALSTTTTGAGWLYGNYPSTPFEQYWFFESDFYAHCVVEYATGFYRHFGLGQLTKTGKYLGGEYYYTSYIRQDTNKDNAISASNQVGFDSNTFGGESPCKIFAQDLDRTGLSDWKGRQSPESGWFNATQFDNTVDGDDGNLGDRGAVFLNGPRKGRHYPLYWTGQSSFSGHRPMFPQFAFTNFNATPDRTVLIGSVPDQRVMSMEGGLSPKDEFTIGADTWIVFPVVRKQPLATTDEVEQSLSFGIAYKKVLT